MNHLIGNERAKQWIARLVDSDRLHQTLLFCGPEGVGKRHFALALGEQLVCTDDNSRSRWRAGHHPDLHLYTPSGKSNLHTIESMRELKSELAMRPNESSRSLFIIDDAERMLPTSSNALLKSLEEPPPHALIILVASDPERLLPTIRSRCRRLPFAPVATEDIEKLVRERHPGLTREAAFRLAVEARGSVGRALAGEENVARRTLLSRLAEPFDFCGAHRTADELSECGEEILEEYLGWFRDLHHIRCGGSKEGLFHPDWEVQLRSQPDPPPLALLEGRVRRAQSALQRGGKMSAALELLLIA